MTAMDQETKACAEFNFYVILLQVILYRIFVPKWNCTIKKTSDQQSNV